MTVLRLKKGDMIMLTESRSGAPTGVVLEVLRKSGSINHTAKDPETGQQYTIYSNGQNPDAIVYADRKVRAEYLKEKIAKTKEEVIEWEAEVDRLLNYDSEEEYVACKLHELMKHGDDKAKMTEILKQLKTSHLL